MLLRHAKSDWDARFSHDRDRPLNGRGEEAARAVGDFLTRIDAVPELGLTSPAVRANSTLELAASFGGWSTPLRAVPELYSSSPGDLLGVVNGVTDVSRLLVVGHEPTLSATVSRLVGGGSFRVPTAALVLLRIAHDEWSSVSWGSAEIHSLWLARTLVKAGFGACRH